MLRIQNRHRGKWKIRPELEQFHSRKLILERRPNAKGGAKLASDILLVRPPGQPRLIQRLLRRDQQTASEGGVTSARPKGSPGSLCSIARGIASNLTFTSMKSAARQALGFFSCETPKGKVLFYRLIRLRSAARGSATTPPVIGSGTPVVVGYVIGNPRRERTAI
jgi:hypothetical protein